MYEKIFAVVLTWRRGAVDIASVSGTEDPGLYPTKFFGKNSILVLNN
jgi:hypothetical protein